MIGWSWSSLLSLARRRIRTRVSANRRKQASEREGVFVACLERKAPNVGRKRPPFRKGLEAALHNGQAFLSMRQEHLDGLVPFVTVAESGGFSAAAVKLGVSPSAVSQSVRQLE